MSKRKKGGPGRGKRGAKARLAERKRQKKLQELSRSKKNEMRRCREIIPKLQCRIKNLTSQSRHGLAVDGHWRDSNRRRVCSAEGLVTDGCWTGLTSIRVEEITPWIELRADTLERLWECKTWKPLAPMTPLERLARCAV